MDKGIALVVPEQNVEPRPVGLDQLILEDQRFALAAGHGDLDVRHPLHELAGLATGNAGTEIGGDPFAQVPRLADV